MLNLHLYIILICQIAFVLTWEAGDKLDSFKEVISGIDYPVNKMFGASRLDSRPKKRTTSRKLRVKKWPSREYFWHVVPKKLFEFCRKRIIEVLSSNSQDYGLKEIHSIIETI